MKNFLYYILLTNIIFSIKSSNDSENTKKKQNIIALEILIKKYKTNFNIIEQSEEAIQTLLKESNATGDMSEKITAIMEYIRKNNKKKPGFKRDCNNKLNKILANKSTNHIFYKSKIINSAIIINEAYNELNQLNIIPKELSSNNPGIREGLSFLISNNLIEDDAQEKEGILLLIIFLKEYREELNARINQL